MAVVLFLGLKYGSDNDDENFLRNASASRTSKVVPPPYLTMLLNILVVARLRVT